MLILDFDYYSLWGVVGITSLLALFVIRSMDKKQKIFFLLVYFFLLIYSGLGGALKSANKEYLFFFFSYISVLSLVLKKYDGKIVYNREELVSLTSFLDLHYINIIIVFILLDLSTLIYPENKLFLLISPPTADNLNHDFTDSGSGGIIEQIIYLLRTTLIPFFYWALYKLRNRKELLIGVLIIDMYIQFCANHYLARNQMLTAALLVFIPYFQSVSSKKKVAFIILTIVAIPFLSYFFYVYSFIRKGHGAIAYSGIDTNMAMQLLLGQEIGYPLYYDYFFEAPYNMIGQYFVWMLLLPLPGFLKFGYGLNKVNYSFSTAVTGLTPTDKGFGVLLPGLVGESIFMFGSYLFLLHALILGLIMKIVCNTLKQTESFTYIYYYFAVEFSFILGRAGTAAVYPRVAKSFFVFLVILYFIKSNKRATFVKQ